MKKDNDNTIFSTVSAKTTIPFYQGILADASQYGPKTPNYKMVLKWVNFRDHAIKNRNPIQKEIMDLSLFLKIIKPQFYYLCKFFNFAPNSVDAARNLQLRWRNGGDKEMPITLNTIGWFGPLTNLVNKFDQTTVTDQFITPNALHSHMFNLNQPDGAKLKKTMTINMPYVNKKKIECVRLDVKNLHPNERKFSIDKDHTTGKYFFREWDPYADSKPENYYDIMSMRASARGIVNYDLMVDINKKLPLKERQFDNLLDLTGQRHLKDLQDSRGYDEVQAFEELLKNNPMLVSFADASRKDIKVSDLAASVRRRRAQQGKYKICNEQGFPTTDKMVSRARVGRFFSRYTDSTISSKIHKGKPFFQAGKVYYVSKNNGDTSEWPQKVRDYNFDFEESHRCADNVMELHYGTSMSDMTADIYKLRIMRFGINEISSILQIAPSEVESHVELGHNILEQNPTPPSKQKAKSADKGSVIDSSLFSFAKLPEMHDYASDIFESYNKAPIAPAKG